MADMLDVIQGWLGIGKQKADDAIPHVNYPGPIPAAPGHAITEINPMNPFNRNTGWPQMLYASMDGIAGGQGAAMQAQPSNDIAILLGYLNGIGGIKQSGGSDAIKRYAGEGMAAANRIGTKPNFSRPRGSGRKSDTLIPQGELANLWAKGRYVEARTMPDHIEYGTTTPRPDLVIHENVHRLQMADGSAPPVRKTPYSRNEAERNRQYFSPYNLAEQEARTAQDAYNFIAWMAKRVFK